MGIACTHYFPKVTLKAGDHVERWPAIAFALDGPLRLDEGVQDVGTRLPRLAYTQANRDRNACRPSD